MPLSGGFKSKRPKLSINHSLATCAYHARARCAPKEWASCSWFQWFHFHDGHQPRRKLFFDPCNWPCQGSLVCEHAIISMIMLDKVLCMGQHFFKCIHGNGFTCHEIVHDVHLHKIADIITKGGTVPDFPAHQETRHPGNNGRLCGDHLIHQDAITWLNMLGAANRSWSILIWAPRATMSRT